METIIKILSKIVRWRKSRYYWKMYVKCKKLAAVAENETEKENLRYDAASYWRWYMEVA